MGAAMQAAAPLHPGGGSLPTFRRTAGRGSGRVPGRSPRGLVDTAPSDASGNSTLSGGGSTFAKSKATSF